LRISYTIGFPVTDSELIDEIERNQDDFLKLLRALVELESPSTNKQLVDRLAVFVAEQLSQNGLTPQFERRSEVGDIVWAEWGRGPAERILVLCHMDTVWEEGALERNPFRMEAGRLYGPGILDMKAGLAATLKIQEFIARGWLHPRKRIRFVYTSDEETGSLFSRSLIEDFARQAELVLLPEPPLPGGVLKTFRKGSGAYIVKAIGKAAHAGVNPHEGVNAVEEIALQIPRIHLLSDPNAGTSVIVTTVRGGQRENVIPDFAQAGVDVRFEIPPEGERVDVAIRRLQPVLPGGRLEIEGLIDRPPMVQTEKGRDLFRNARSIAAGLGINLREGRTGGGSDGSFSAALGVPTLDGLGIPGSGAHAPDEHIELATITPRVALLARLLERL
jgi:glutamate carboxypeptidase